MKLTGNEPAYPNGMWGQQTSQGLTVFQMFCLHAPDEPKAWEYKGKLFIQDPIRWRVCYAQMMIDKMNELEPNPDSFIYIHDLNIQINSIIDTLEVARDKMSPVHIQRAINELNKIIDV